jgi:hypothetical protein
VTGSHEKQNAATSLVIAAVAAFCTYFCMYAFRKPFTAGTYVDQEVFGFGLKSTVVIAQLLGYMLSKFLGIKFVSEMPPKYRGLAILALIAIAEIALVGFAVFPSPLVKAAMMFLNGLPLGMVFGLVLAYLEGRRQTEALSAALCASFIVSSGVVKSVGRWLISDWGVSEFTMPMLVGLLFLPILLVSVWMLQFTPPPDGHDRALRSVRNQMTRSERKQFMRTYWPGLMMLLFVYVALTVVRTARDDFAVEIWRDMGVSETPSVFAVSETWVALFVTAFNGLAIWITHNLAAIRIAILAMCCAFTLVVTATIAQASGTMSAMVFMVTCGIGLYVPYVAFHTTLFERLIAASTLPSNLGFLMYVADAVGYLGYSAVLVLRSSMTEPDLVLPSFRWALVIGSATSIIALVGAFIYFQGVLRRLPIDVEGQAIDDLSELTNASA